MKKEKREKMKKRIFKTAALAALIGAGAFGLASCNGAPYKDEVITVAKKEFAAPTNWQAPTTPTYSASTTDTGTVVNIRVWNDEFIKLFKNYYPGAVETKTLEEFTMPNPYEI